MFCKKVSLLGLVLVSSISLQGNNTFFNDPFGDDIFKEMMQMQHEMDKMFDQIQKKVQHSKRILSSPRHKILKQPKFIDKGNKYEYVTNIPENIDNEIQINVKNSILFLTAKIIHTQESNKRNHFTSTSSMRMYTQSISLPIDADEGSLNARYLNKKLLITIEKKKPKSTSQTSTNSEIKKEDNSTSKEHNISHENNISKKYLNHNDLDSMS